MPAVLAVAEGSDARLPCVSVANPATEFTNWTRHGEDVRSARFAVLEKGSLLIQDVRRTDAGEYACTPYNKVGAGITEITRLVLKGRLFRIHCLFRVSMYPKQSLILIKTLERVLKVVTWRK